MASPARIVHRLAVGLVFHVDRGALLLQPLRHGEMASLARVVHRLPAVRGCHTDRGALILQPLRHVEMASLARGVHRLIAIMTQKCLRLYRTEKVHCSDAFKHTSKCYLRMPALLQKNADHYHGTVCEPKASALVMTRSTWYVVALVYLSLSCSAFEKDRAPHKSVHHSLKKDPRWQPSEDGPAGMSTLHGHVKYFACTQLNDPDRASCMQVFKT